MGLNGINFYIWEYKHKLKTYKYSTYINMSNISVPLSLGECLDKLTILDIKMEKIKDSRRDDCVKEYNVLYDTLKEYVNKYSYHYKTLKNINYIIWGLQENLHTVKDKIKIGEICTQILVDNDRRFRVKKMINTISNSNLKEQKGYAKTQAFFYGHLGLGDMFWMNGAVRYLATAYDEVNVVCKKNNEVAVKLMYSDNPCIKLFIVNDDIVNFPNYIQELQKNGYDTYSCGLLKANPKLYEFPLSFYDDINMPRHYRTTFFYIPDFNEGQELLEKIQKVSKEYILIHQQASHKTIDIFSHLTHLTIPILDINKNHYEPGHKFYEVAQLVVNQPMPYYKQLIENAKEIYCIESSFYCLASHLDLSKVEKKVCFYPCDDSAKRIGVFETGYI